MSLKHATLSAGIVSSVYGMTLAPFILEDILKELRRERRERQRDERRDRRRFRNSSDAVVDGYQE